MFEYLIGLVVALVGYRIGVSNKDKTLIVVSLVLATIAAFGVGAEFRTLIRG